MDSYDSDSSASDLESGVSTNVLLGYAAEETPDDTFSQLGGKPSWLDPSQHPAPSLVQCKICSSYLALLLQLNGDLPAKFPGHERRLYIWACRQNACRRKGGSIRGVRGVRITKEHSRTDPKRAGANLESQPAPATKNDLGSTLFGAKPSSSASSGANPFSSSTQAISSGAATAANPFSSSSQLPSVSSAQTPADLPYTFAEKARISLPHPSSSNPASSISPPKPWPEPSSFPAPYAQSYLDADYEYLTPQIANGPNSHHTSFLDADTSTNADNPSSSSTVDEKDAYESAHDKTFQHFADVLSQNPDQVLRYEFGGSPLLYSRADAVGRLFPTHSAASSNVKVTTTTAPGGSRIPRCTMCGTERVFELQMTPHAIVELERDDDAEGMLSEGMEWGTLILGVCARDCAGGAEAGEGKVAYVEEWVGVQWEEVVQRR